MMKGEFEFVIQDCNKIIDSNGFIGTEATEREMHLKYAYLLRGLSFIAREDLDHAIRDFDEAINLGESALSYLFRGVAYFYKKDYSQALKNYTLVLSLDPSDSQAYFGRGYIRFLMGDLQGSKEDYAKIIELNPKEGGGYAFRAEVYKKEGNVAAALEDFQRAIQIGPSDKLYLTRGVFYHSIEEYEKAELDYIQAGQMNPNREKEVKFLIECLKSCKTKDCLRGIPIYAWQIRIKDQAFRYEIEFLNL